MCTRSPRLTTAVPHDISPVVALDGACLTDGVRRLRSFLHPTLLLLVEDDVLVARAFGSSDTWLSGEAEVLAQVSVDTRSPVQAHS